MHPLKRVKTFKDAVMLKSLVKQINRISYRKDGEFNDAEDMDQFIKHSIHLPNTAYIHSQFYFFAM